MTKRKKVGVVIPDRPLNQLNLRSDVVSIGCLSPLVREPLFEKLRANDSIELYEQLDLRNALILNGKVYCDGFCLNDLDRLVWYWDVDRNPGSFDIELLRTLSRDVEVIPNPFNYEVGIDKYKAHLKLREAGVNVSDSAMFDLRVPEMMHAVLEEWGAALLKPRRGGWGKGVTLIDSVDRLRDIVGYIASTSENSSEHGFFLERYYENDPNRWASITMINGEIAQAYRKVDAKFHDLGNGRFKVLDADEKGGGTVLADLTPAHIEQAHRAYDALGLAIVGFDMIWTKDGPIIVDENTAPGNYINLYQEEGKDPVEIFNRLILDSLFEKEYTNAAQSN